MAPQMHRKWLPSAQSCAPVWVLGLPELPFSVQRALETEKFESPWAKASLSATSTAFLTHAF